MHLYMCFVRVSTVQIACEHIKFVSSRLWGVAGLLIDGIVLTCAVFQVAMVVVCCFELVLEVFACSCFDRHICSYKIHGKKIK